MGQLRRIRKEPHYLSQEEELEARRILLAGARKGDRKAKTELMESYGVKIYSQAERLRTKVVEPLTLFRQRTRNPSKKFPPAQDRLPAGPSRKAGKKSL